MRGIALRWRTPISAWQPPHRFVAEQIRGPYWQWIHAHTFEAREAGVLARDDVRYAVPFDFVAHLWWVRADVERIFQCRSEALPQRPGEGQRPAP